MKTFQMPDSRFQIALAAGILALSGCAFFRPKPAAPSLPITMVAEMEPIAGVDGGTPCKPGEFADDVAKALADWATRRRLVARLLTPERVRELSRWAKKQMEPYRRVPPLGKVVFKPLCCHKDAHALVLEGVVDTLPTHSSLVTRWLKIYLVYDQEKQAVVKIAVTIRGQLLE